MPGYANPQNLNRYSYVTNNPLRYTDPTGHMLDYGSNEGGGGFIHPSPPTTPAPPDPPDHPDIDLPGPDELSCGGLLNCDQQSIYELLPLVGPNACEFLLQNNIPCDANVWSSFLDPFNPYSLNGVIPGFMWDSTNVPWLTVHIDAVGIAGDLLPVLQPGAEGIEVINYLKYAGKWHAGLGLGFDEVDFLSTYVLQQNEQFDWINLGLDTVSLVPEVGVVGSFGGLLYNLGKGINSFNSVDALYGLPMR